MFIYKKGGFMKKYIIIIFFNCIILLLGCSRSENGNSEILKMNVSGPVNTVDSILYKEIVLNYGFAGQSLTLVYENNNYYIYRNIYGSGVPIIGTIKYNVILNSEHKITFFEIIEISENIENDYVKNETFEIYCRDELKIYLNGIQISINYIINKK
jgi:hypothetical protein